MARRSTTTQSEAPAQDIATTTEESTVSTDTAVPEASADAPATEAPNTDAPATEAAKPADKPIDLTAFNQAVDVAVNSRDESTGVITDENLEPVTKSYRDLDGVKAKNAAKAVINEHLKSAINELDIIKGKAFMSISESLTAGASSTPKVREPADPTEAYVQRLAVINLAYNLVVSNVPEGVDSGTATDKVNEMVTANLDASEAYLAWAKGDDETRGDEPEASTAVKLAVKLAMGKSTKVGTGSAAGSTYTGERRDILEHIKQAFADKESGDFLTIAEMRNFKSTEYGNEPPSAGAISARLFPSGNANPSAVVLAVVTPNQNEKGNRGATKV